MSKRPDKFKRWMIASFFLIPLVIFGSIGVYYAYFPVKMRVLIRLLGYDRTSFWAWQRIRDEGDRAIPHLINSFASTNDRVRSEALSVFCGPLSKGFNPEVVVPCLVKGLKSKNARVREYSAWAVYRFADRQIGGRKALPRVRAVLSEMAETLPSKAHFLQILRENKVVGELIRLLSDPEAKVRRIAAYALGQIGDHSAIPELIRILSDPEAKVRRMAASALGQIGDHSAIPELIRILSDPEGSVRASAARSLGYLSAKEAAPHLIKLLSDSSARVRSAAASSLVPLEAKEAAPQLMRLLSDPDRRVRSSAARALGWFKQERAVPQLIKLLSDPSDWVRRSASASLRAIGSIEAVRPLIACLEEAAMSLSTQPKGEKIQQELRQALIWDLLWALEGLTGESFGDRHAVTTDSQRQAIAQKWLDWWEENKEK